MTKQAGMNGLVAGGGVVGKLVPRGFAGFVGKNHAALFTLVPGCV